MAATIENSVNPDSASWINGLASIMRQCDSNIDLGLKTTISSDGQNGKLALYVPTEMSELQPENLRYLHALASRYDCTLIEDRRGMNTQPLVERRDLKPHQLALGVAELLKQAGMPGAKPELSTPHRLRPDNPRYSLPLLIDMVASSVGMSKHVVIQPSQTLVATTGNETHPISAFGCRLITAEANLTLSYFDSPGFKAIGYVASSQFVMHVLVGGGPLRSPQIWANYDAMQCNRFRFQLFRSALPGQDFGLLYNTFYLDIKKEVAKKPSAQISSAHNTTGAS